MATMPPPPPKGRPTGPPHGPGAPPPTPPTPAGPQWTAAAPRPRWPLYALVTALVLGGGALVWIAVSGGGDEEMEEGTVTIATVDEGDDGTVPDETDSTTVATTVPVTSTPPATTVAPSTTIVETTTVTTATPTTEAPTTAPPTAPPTIPTTVAPATTAPPTTVAPPTTAGPVVLTNRCESTEYGWDVGYPDGWFTVDASEPAWACSAFDRQPISLDEELEVPIFVTFIEVHYADIIAGYYEGEWAQVVSDTAATVGFYDAARIEWVSTGMSEVPAGIEGIAYVVDRGGWSTVLLEGYAWSDDYLELVEIVDAMAADIQFWDS